MSKIKLSGRRVLALVLALVLVLSLCVTGFAFASGSEYQATFPVTYQQTEARKLTDQINSFRTGSDAWYWDADDLTRTNVSGLKNLTYDYDLEAIAMQRAAELAVSYDHNRPDGSTFDTALAEYSYSAPAGESIFAGGGYYAKTASLAMDYLKEADNGFSGQNDRRNMLNESYTRIGCSCVYLNNTYYWVILFANSGNSSTAVAANDSTTDVTVPIAENRLLFSGDSASFTDINMNIAGTQAVPDLYMYVRPTYTAGSCSGMDVVVSGYSAWTSADSGIVRISNGQMTASGIGDVKLAATVNGTTVSFYVTVTGTVTHADKEESTCAVQGHNEYWYVEETGQYFSDSGMTNEVSYADLTLPLADHQYESGGIEGATCTEDGHVSYVCSVCGNAYTETIPATGHEYIIMSCDSTCTEDGAITYQCMNCKDSYTIPIPAKGHSWDDGTVTREPSSTSEGEMTYTCTECGATYTAVIPHVDCAHNWEDCDFSWNVDENGMLTCEATFICSECGEMETVEPEITAETTIKPTCQSKGETVYTAEAESPDGEYIATDTWKEETFPVSHEFEATVSMPSTCASNGYTEYECVNCGYTYREELPLTGDHSWDEGMIVKDATADEDGEIVYTCTECGTVMSEVIPATGEDTAEPEDTNIPDDTESSDTDTKSDETTSEADEDAPVVHQWTPRFNWAENGQSCTVTFTCDDCGATDGPFDCEIGVVGDMSVRATFTATYVYDGEGFSDSMTVRYSDDVYDFVWNDDYTACTLYINSGATMAVTCNVGWMTLTESSCTENGVREYVAWYGNIVSEPVKTEVIPSMGHDWNYEFIWTDNYTECRAIFTCNACDESGAMDCNVTEEDGVYTAVCTFDGQTWTGTATATQANDENHSSLTSNLEELLVSAYSLLENNDYSDSDIEYLQEAIAQAEEALAGESSDEDLQYAIQALRNTIISLEPETGEDSAESDTGNDEQQTRSDHDWQIEWNWGDDPETCEAVITCRDCGETSGVLEANVEQTAETDDTIFYKATVTYDFWGDFSSTCTVYKADGTFSYSWFEWNDLGTECMYYEIYDDTTMSSACETGWITTKEATCTEDGIEEFYAWCDNVYSDPIMSVKVDMTGHTWRPSFDWESTNGCVVTFECEDCAEQDGPFSCTVTMKDGGAVASYIYDGVTYTNDHIMASTDTYTGFRWNDENTECWYDTIDEDGNVVSEECELEWRVTLEPTCTTPGRQDYVAIYEMYISAPVDTEAIPATGHTYGIPSFIWTTDEEIECDAVFMCDVCGDTMKIGCVIIDNGDGTYSAMIDNDGMVYTSTTERLTTDAGTTVELPDDFEESYVTSEGSEVVADDEVEFEIGGEGFVESDVQITEKDTEAAEPEADEQETDAETAETETDEEFEDADEPEDEDAADEDSDGESVGSVDIDTTVDSTKSSEETDTEDTESTGNDTDVSSRTVITVKDGEQAEETISVEVDEDGNQLLGTTTVKDRTDSATTDTADTDTSEAETTADKDNSASESGSDSGTERAATTASTTSSGSSGSGTTSSGNVVTVGTPSDTGASVISSGTSANNNDDYAVNSVGTSITGSTAESTGNVRTGDSGWRIAILCAEGAGAIVCLLLAFPWNNRKKSQEG